MHDKIHIRNLGSSSSGNSTLIWSGKDALLVDIGFSQRYMHEKLEESNVTIDMLKGVLITHLHGDHITQAMLNKILREGITVFLHRNLKPAFYKRFRIKNEKNVVFFAEQPFSVGPFRVNGFEVPHDSSGGCFGFQIHLAEKKISLSTDMGFTRNGLARQFLNSDLIILESNHDPHLLETSGRSSDLIDRIQQIGHLSNSQCTDFLGQIIDGSKKLPRAIALAHLSEDCNRPAIAKKNVEKFLRVRDIQNIDLHIFKKNQVSTLITI